MVDTRVINNYVKTSRIPTSINKLTGTYVWVSSFRNASSNFSNGAQKFSTKSRLGIRIQLRTATHLLELTLFHLSSSYLLQKV